MSTRGPPTTDRTRSASRTSPQTKRRRSAGACASSHSRLRSTPGRIRLSKTVTRWPSRRNAAVTLLPMNPAPPVTMTCKLVPPEWRILRMGSVRPAAVRRRLTLAGLGGGDEALELTLGHAVAQLGAPGPEAAQLPLAQPAPHRLGRRPKSFGHLAHREQTLFVHRVPEAAFHRGCRSQRRRNAVQL